MGKGKIGVGFGVMLMKDGKVLLGQRHVDPDKADSELRGEGTWTMPGGKLHYQEGFEEGAAREVAEETGIRLSSAKVIAVNNDYNQHAHFVTIGLYSDDFSGEPQVLEPDEIIRWEWFGLDELPEPLFEPSKKLIANYEAGKFYLKK